MKNNVKTVLLAACTLFLTLLFVLTCSAAAGTGADGRRVCKSHPGPLLTLSDLAKTAEKRNGGPMRAPSPEPAVSDLPLVVIVVGFADLPYSESFDWSAVMFGEGNSLAEFYSDMSLGQFTFTPVQETAAFGGENRNTADAANDGVIHVTLKSNHDDWRLEYPFMSKKDIAANRTLSEAMLAALHAADAYLDFSAYDTDENGAITTDELAVGFVFAGYEASTSDGYQFGNSRYLWSHAYSLQELRDDYSFSFSLPSPDGVTVSSYIAISEREEDGSQEPYATLAHELGHYIGLPDLYDTSYDTTAQWGKYDVGCMSLMCMDVWEHPETGEMVPTPLDAWSRVILGWVTPEEAGTTGEYTLAPQTAQDGGGYNVLKIATQNPGEYYLLENRALTKWDAPITEYYATTAGGVVFWHIDDGVYDLYFDDNLVNDSFHRPAVMPLYPESNRGGAYTFTGKNSTVYTNAPFFDLSVWNEKFGHLGTALDLPVYGTGDNADLRSGRGLSGVLVQFLSDAGGEIRIRLDAEHHSHNPVQVNLQAPTCTAAGLAYFECPQCGARFTDATGAVRTENPVEVPALGHTDPNASGACDRCGELVVGEDQLCPYCGSYHSGAFFQRLVSAFHRVLYFFMHLFGRM